MLRSQSGSETRLPGNVTLLQLGESNEQRWRAANLRKASTEMGHGCFVFRMLLCDPAGLGVDSGNARLHLAYSDLIPSTHYRKLTFNYFSPTPSVFQLNVCFAVIVHICEYR